MDRTPKHYQILKQFANDEQSAKIDLIISEGSIRKASKKAGVSHQALQRTIASLEKRAAKQGLAPEFDMTHQAAPGFGVTGVSTLYGSEGDVTAQWVKVSADKEKIEQSIDEIVEALNIPKFKPVKPPKHLSEDLMNVYVFGDSHIDMLAWSVETGANWDLEIAVHHHMSAMTDMVDRSPKCDTGVLATMGDLFHRDSLKAITPNGGNLVDVDGRLGQSWDRGVEMIRAMIDKMLKKYQKVKYVCVRGNHSETLELVLAKTIRIAYENEPRVEVLENTPKEIPLSFDNNFLLFVHGDGLNDQKKADLVTGRYRSFHGNAQFSHLLSGHIHFAQQKEMSGVLVETFPVLPTPDAWHCANGYMSASQGASVLTYHTNGGLVNRTITNPRIYLE